MSPPARGAEYPRNHQVINTFGALLILSIPAIVPIIFLHGLSTPLHTFHWMDEPDFHYPTIMEFYRSFPYINLSDYSSATTPLSHIIFAAIAKIIGPEISGLRLFNAFIGYLGASLLFYWFSGPFRMSIPRAVLLSLTFYLAPYNYGSSFIVMTDAIGILFAIASLASLHISLDRECNKYFILSVIFSCLAIMTRQLYIWIAAVIALSIVYDMFLRGRTEAGRLILRSTALAVSLAPLAALAVLWGGLNPPRFQMHLGMQPASVSFFIACIGLYSAPFILLRTLLTPEQKIISLLYKTAILLALSLAILEIAPLQGKTLGGFSHDGIVWRLSSFASSIGGFNMIMVLLIILGLACLHQALIRVKTPQNTPDPESIFIVASPLFIAISFAVAITNSYIIYQKYYELPAMMIAMITFCTLQPHREERLGNIVLLSFVVLSACYAFLNPFS